MKRSASANTTINESSQDAAISLNAHRRFSSLTELKGLQIVDVHKRKDNWPSNEENGCLLPENLKYTPCSSTKSFDGIILPCSESESEDSSKLVRPIRRENRSETCFRSRGGDFGCDMCANYEQKLVQAQERERQLIQELRAMQSTADRYKEDLTRERNFRADLESKTAVIVDDAANKVATMYQEINSMLERVNQQKSVYDASLQELHTRIAAVIKDRDETQEAFERMEVSYEKLLGKHRISSEKMRSEAIDFPQTVEDLQLCCLELRENLIEEKTSKEYLEELKDELKSEIVVFREQQLQAQRMAAEREKEFQRELASVRSKLSQSDQRIKQHEAEVQGMHAERRKFAHLDVECERLRAEIRRNAEERRDLEEEIRSLRSRAHALQLELDNSETVQRDFVRLSQSLQVELEKIRQAETEVRWQHPDDIVLCNGCKQPFHKTRHKQHCWHCGKIYCGICVTKSVPSGPQQRSAPVCDVCFTLLVTDSAPYFSVQVPNSAST